MSLDQLNVKQYKDKVRDVEDRGAVEEWILSDLQNKKHSQKQLLIGRESRKLKYGHRDQQKRKMFEEQPFDEEEELTTKEKKGKKNTLAFE